jgi:hypothetical protein
MLISSVQGPVPWLYMSEIFPTRIREIGIAIGTATQWLFNFVFSQATPHAVDNMGWRTFLMFCIFNWAIVVYVFIFIKETTGKSLEEMEDGMRLSLFLISYLINRPQCSNPTWFGSERMKSVMWMRPLRSKGTTRVIEKIERRE